MRTLVFALFAFAAPTLAAAQALTVVRLPGGEVIPRSGTSEAEADFVAASMPVTLERVPRAEREALPRSVAAAYARMHERAGTQPSIWSTSVGGENTALISPPMEGGAVVFLHGLGGNFTWPCHLVAEAARAASMSTICPSLDADAHWSNAEGLERVRAAIALMRERGAERVVLAGLSRGGVGASQLARRLGSEIDGLILLSGVDGRARAPQPTFLLHGTHDRMVGTAAARRFARRHRGAEAVFFEGGHFVLAERPDDARDAIARWLNTTANSRSGSRRARR